MPTGTQIKPTHKAVKAYYAALETYAGQSVAHEGAVRSAFQNLLADTGRKFGWTLIPELTIDANGHQIRPDGTFRDEYTIERGYWEAKDTDDDLDTEIGKKVKRGYRLTNTIFEDTREARLYHNGKLAFVADLAKPQQLCDLLNTFFAHTEPAHEDFSKAVDEFKQRVLDLALGLMDLIKRAHNDNPRFARATSVFPVFRGTGVVSVTVLVADPAIGPVDHDLGPLVLGDLPRPLDGFSLCLVMGCVPFVALATDRPVLSTPYNVLVLLTHLRTPTCCVSSPHSFPRCCGRAVREYS